MFFISRVQQTGTGFLFYFNGEFSLLIVLRSKTEIFSLPPKLMIKNCTVYDFESWEKIGSNKRVVKYGMQEYKGALLAFTLYVLCTCTIGICPA